MALLYNFGSVLVDAEEVSQRQHLGEFDAFLRRATKGLDAKMEFRAGTLEASDFLIIAALDFRLSHSRVLADHSALKFYAFTLAMHHKSFLAERKICLLFLA
ncbi:MAG: hypothetical protein HC912_07020 [Saprospiraceae bacterium]|nr:hypothetical protein [Saprospiraceae bacterium]